MIFDFVSDSDTKITARPMVRISFVGSDKRFPKEVLITRDEAIELKNSLAKAVKLPERDTNGRFTKSLPVKERLDVPKP